MSARSRIRAVTPARSTSRAIKHRLTEALSTFTTTQPSQRPTVSSLCRLADVSRNTLYRYYPDIARAVRRIRQRGGARRRQTQRHAFITMHAELTLLRAQLSQLATLADHYHTAAEELRTLLGRRDRELAALRDRPRPRAARIDRAPHPLSAVCLRGS